MHNTRHMLHLSNGARCSTFARPVRVILVRRSIKPGFVLKHTHRRNQVRHTGGSFKMKISAEKTEAGYRPTVGKRLLLPIIYNTRVNTCSQFLLCTLVGAVLARLASVPPSSSCSSSWKPWKLLTGRRGLSKEYQIRQSNIVFFY